MPSPEKLVLVTGATGFTGQHLCRRLLAEGFAVRALSRRRDSPQDQLARGVVPAFGDVRDSSSLDPACKGVHTVYHLAAAFRPGRLSRGELRDTNIGGTRKLVEAAVRAGVRRFVHCSSVGVHGQVKRPPADEYAPFRPGDDYQESKLQGELVARQLALIHGLPLVVVRPAGIYGPGDLRFLKLVKLAQHRVIPLIGNGRVLYQMVFIDDLVDGLVRAGATAGAAGKTYILTGWKATTLREIVETVAANLGRKRPMLSIPIAPVYLLSIAVEAICAPLGLEPPLFRRRLDIFHKDRSFTIERASRELGYHPKTDLAEGFAKTIAWYRSQGLIA